MAEEPFLQEAKLWLTVALILIGLILLVRIIQFILHIRDNRRRMDYWNNKPEGVKWWHYILMYIFGFMWFVFITKNKDFSKKQKK